MLAGGARGLRRSNCALLLSWVALLHLQLQEAGSGRMHHVPV